MAELPISFKNQPNPAKPIQSVSIRRFNVLTLQHFNVGILRYFWQNACEAGMFIAAIRPFNKR
jgi:hypothetical protein